jgi:DNA-binding NtrC family response regulator
MPAILIIEDEHALGTALSFAARRAGHIPTLVASGQAGLESLKRETFAAIVLDIGLPDMSGLAVLEKLRAQKNATPVLVITAHATLDHAINAQKLGATDYLTKPLDLRQFETALAALITPSVPVEAIAAAPPTKPAATTLIGAAPCLQEVFLGIARSCAGDMPALITGPSGAGKTLAARVIHAHGPRSAQPLRLIECSTIKDAAALDEYLANGEGTLVLEEIIALAPAVQTRLAAVLSEPATKRPRLLATTSTDPREAVTQGTLRAELFYAFSALTIPMPPLRERTGDVPALSAFFLGLRDSAAVTPITPPALAAMQGYEWPGNVRELRHALDYAATMSRGGPIFLSHLPPHIAATVQTASASPASGELDVAITRWLDSQMAVTPEESRHYDGLLDQVEAIMLRHLLEKFDNRPTHLAAALRMNRATLRQKLRRAGLQRDE